MNLNPDRPKFRDALGPIQGKEILCETLVVYEVWRVVGRRSNAVGDDSYINVPWRDRE